MSKQEEFINYLTNFIGTPYFFGGNSTTDGGLDCSGLILEGLRAFGLWGLSDVTSQNIFNTFTKYQVPITSELMLADLLFFGKSTNSITHISTVANSSQVIEAGGSNTNGMTRLRPITWRKDLVSVVRLPFK